MEYEPLTAEEAQGLAETPTPALMQSVYALTVAIVQRGYGMFEYYTPYTADEMHQMRRTRHLIRVELAKRGKFEYMNP